MPGESETCASAVSRLADGAAAARLVEIEEHSGKYLLPEIAERDRRASAGLYSNTATSLTEDEKTTR